MKNILIIALLLFCYTSSYAAECKQTTPKTPEISDWNQLASTLRLKGIVINQLNWNEIESICIFFKSLTSELEYNKCRLIKALEQNKFDNDRNYCNGVVEEKLFQYTQTTRTNSKFFDLNGHQVTGVIESKTNLSDKEVNNFKVSSYITCMYETGWNNPNSWLNGRRE